MAKKYDSALAADAIDTLIARAQSAKFWEDHGTRGDGNLDAALERLAAARREALALIPQNAA